jgi:predicted transcriptional regulator
MKKKIKHGPMTNKLIKWAEEHQSDRKPDACYEFSHLMISMRVLGFRPADVARMLNKSQGAISQYLSGYTKPSETVLALLRRLVVEKQVKQTPGVYEDLINKLTCLQHVMPTEYQAIKENIETCYEKTMNLKSSLDVERVPGGQNIVVGPLPHKRISLKAGMVRSPVKSSTKS